MTGNVWTIPKQVTMQLQLTNSLCPKVVTVAAQWSDPTKTSTYLRNCCEALETQDSTLHTCELTISQKNCACSCDSDYAQHSLMLQLQYTAHQSYNNTISA